jgi:thioredoxin reductase (NADPH)
MAENQPEYDVVILGTGPAGLQAAIHAGRRRARVLILGRERESDLFWAHIENFCCIFNLPGKEMLEVGREQATNFGAKILDEDALHVSREDGIIKIKTESGKEIESHSLIIATGTSRNKLGVPGEKELLGRGVSYCVDCDAMFYRDQVVALVGDGSAAADGALTMLGYASEVHLVSEDLDISAPLRAELEESDVVLHQGAKVKEILGDGKVAGLALDNDTNLDINGVFIELGAKGVMELAATLMIDLDESMKYIETDKEQQTNVDGIYAAGDVCGPPFQMAKAVGEGCVAGLNAASYAKQRQRQQDHGDTEAQEEREPAEETLSLNLEI